MNITTMCLDSVGVLFLILGAFLYERAKNPDTSWGIKRANDSVEKHSTLATLCLLVSGALAIAQAYTVNPGYSSIIWQILSGLGLFLSSVLAVLSGMLFFNMRSAKRNYVRSVASHAAVPPLPRRN